MTFTTLNQFPNYEIETEFPYTIRRKSDNKIVHDIYTAERYVYVH